MNKIQLVILWCMGIIFSLIAINKAFTGYGLEFNPVIGIIIPVLIVGCLLVYTVRSKK